MPKSGSKTPTVDLMDARYGKKASERYNLSDEMTYDPAGKNLIGRIKEAARSTNARIRNTGKVNNLDPGAGRLDVVDPQYMSDDFYNRNYGTEYRDVTSSVKKFKCGGTVKHGYSVGGDVRYSNKGKCY
jgi:hypothetical protein